MDDLLSEFLTETAEGLGTLDIELVRLEQNPNDPALLGNIFRMVHTIKGTCGFLSLPRLEAVAHASENVLGRIRDGELAVTPIAISLILSSLDRIKMLLAALEATEAEPDGNDAELIEQLNALAEGRLAANAAVEVALPPPIVAAPPPPIVAAPPPPQIEVPAARIEAPPPAQQSAIKEDRTGQIRIFGHGTGSHFQR